MRRRSSSESYSDIERKREKRRIAWMIEQEKEREHERLKRKKIEEYERRRAEQLGLNKQRSSRRSRSKSRSRSRSDESHHRSRLKSKPKKCQIMSEKRNLADGNKSLFKGPEQSQKLDISELKQVTVKIHRKIPGAAAETNEIRRIIVNPEEITLKRREGEGTKPIFDREELKSCDKPVEVEEHRTIEAVGKASAVKRLQAKRRSVSISPKRRRSPSPHSRSTTHTHHSRSSEYTRYRPEDNREKDYKSDGYYTDTRESRESSRRSRKSEDRSYSKERDYHKSKHDYSRTEKERREYSERFKDLSYDRRERRERESSRERHLPPPSQYLEQVPYPVYYGGFAPRPMLIRPAVPPIRGPLVRGRVPTPMRPPYPPRFIGPQDIYRVVLPHDPRYGQMY